jgi:O-antigen/teichoic acid export membrane protein
VKAVTRRAGWGLLDQVLSSATNFALGIFVAATVTPQQFGAFSIVYGAYGICLGLSAGIASTPLIVRFSAVEGEDLRRAERSSVGAALSIGLIAGAVCLTASAFSGSAAAHALRALGVLLPGLLAQDAWRFAFMARGRPKMAAANDGLWAVLQVLGTLAVLATHSVSATSMVIVWGGSATVAAAAGCVQANALPAVNRARRWVHEQRDLAPRYALESMAHRSGGWLAIAAVGATAGLPTVAALRGAMLLVTGPLNLLFVGAAFVAVPETVRLVKASPQRLPRLTWLISLSIAGLSACWCGVVLVLSGVVGPRLLGETWPLAQPLLFVLSFFAIAQALAIGPAQGLWALGAAGRSLKSQLINVVLMLAATSAGAALDGARGAAIGLVITAGVSLFVWRWQFRLSFSEARPEPTSSGSLDDEAFRGEPPASDLTMA